MSDNISLSGIFNSTKSCPLHSSRPNGIPFVYSGQVQLIFTMVM